MVIKKAPDTGRFENEADKKVLSDIAAIRAAGGDPLGDEDDETTIAATAAAAADTDDADAAEEALTAALADDADHSAKLESAVAAEAQAPAAAAEQAPEQPAQALYETKPASEIAESRKALRAEKAKAFADFDEGTINPAEYQAIVDRVDDSLEQLIVQSTLATANEQSELRTQTAAIEGLIARAKADGSVDYKEPGSTAPSEFNAALQLLAGQSATAALPYAKLVDKAHAMVMAMRGATAAPAAAPSSPAGGSTGASSSSST